MNEEPKQQTATETKINVKQKVLFVLAVIGLIGFGIAIAVIAQTTVPSEEPVTQPAVTYDFYAPTIEGLKEQMLAKAGRMNLTKDQINQMVVLVEDGDINPTAAPWYDIRPHCDECSQPSKVGYCIFGGCGSGGCSGSGCHVQWNYVW